MTALLFKEEIKDWAKKRLDEISKEQENILKEQEVLLSMLALQEYLAEEEEQPTEEQPTEEKKSKKSPGKAKPKDVAPTAASLLKFPDLGLKGSILMVLKANKRKKLSIPEIAAEILTISTDDPNYKKVAGSIRQTLRIGAQNHAWNKVDNGGKTTYGM